MKQQKKILIISGSPRSGNTEFVLKEIFKKIDGAEKEIIFLRDKKIGICRGCLACHHRPVCAIKDDMNQVLDKMAEADILILGTPNYFDNVSGLMKNFIDRCHPFYREELLRGKKVFLVYVGGGEKQGTTKYLNLAFFGFVKYLKLKLIGVCSFQALKAGELKSENIAKEIEKIIKIVKKAI
ncbi:MAG: flavodoxin family protein [Patescibacteria group bacterium]|nr:flavodoxin family protein [Patescibacteria group bacterium]MDD4610653.1 flavodoxin family protein [Patescibacteria group bacterium]